MTFFTTYFWIVCVYMYICLREEILKKEAQDSSKKKFLEDILLRRSDVILTP